MSIYVTDLVEIERVVGSRDNRLARRLWLAVREEATEHQLDELASLVGGDYPKDEQVDERGPDLIHAFEFLCRELCLERATIEMDDDPDATPLLWDFLWSDSDNDNPLRLPFSRSGTPAVAWHTPAGAAFYHGEFRNWRLSEAVDERFLRLDELDELVRILGEAVEGGRGVFVFYAGG